MAEEIASLFARIGADLTQLEAGLAKASGMLTTAGRKMASAGDAMTMGVTMPLAAAAAGAVGMARAFDVSMRNVNSVLLLNEAQFQNMTSEVLDFSMTTRSSATEVAGALLTVSQAGFRGSEAMELMKLSSRAAGAAFTSSEDMARLLVSAINSYGLQVSDAARLNDLFIYSMQKGAGSVTQLSAEMGTVFPSAKAAQVGIDELMASMTLLVRGGLSTAEASTSLNRLLLATINPSTELAAALKAAGYESGQAALKAVGLAGVMKIVEAAANGNADAMKKMYPLTQAIRGAYILAADGGEKLNAQLKDFKENAGGAMEAARTQQYASLDAQMKMLTNTMQSFGIEIGQQVLPVVVNMAEEVVPRLRAALRGVSDESMETGIKMLGIVAAAGPLLSISGRLIATLGELVKLMPLLKTLPAVFGSTGAAGMAALGPLALVVAPLAAGLLLVKKNAAEVRAEIDKMTGGGWENFWQAQADGVKSTADQMAAFVAIVQKAQGMSGGPFGAGFKPENFDFGGASRSALDAANSYDEYQSSIIKVAEALGLEIDAQGNLVEAYDSGMGAAGKRMIAQNFLMSESQMRNIRLYQAGARQLQQYGGVVQGVAGGMRILQEQQAKAGKGLPEDVIAPTLAAADALSLLRARMEEAGLSTEAIESQMARYGVELGTQSAAQNQLNTDIQLLNEALMTGAITSGQWVQYMQQAGQGTLELSNGLRATLQSHADYAASTRDSAAATQELRSRQLELAQSLKDATQAQVAQAMIGELGRLQQLGPEAGGIDFETYASAVSSIQETFGLADEKSRALAEGIGLLGTALTTGQLPASMMGEALKTLYLDAADGQLQIGLVNGQIVELTNNAVQPAIEPAGRLAEKFGEFKESITEIPIATGEMVTTFSVQMDDMKVYAQTGSDGVRTAFTSVGWGGVGMSISNGIANGILAGIPAIEAAATAAANAAKEATEEATDSHSPSRVFAKIGRQTMEGFALGIKQYSKLASEAATKAVRATAVQNITNTRFGDAPQYIEQNFFDDSSAALGMAIVNTSRRQRLNASMSGS